MKIADRPTPLTDARVIKMLSSLQSGTEDVVRAEHARALEQACEALIELLTGLRYQCLYPSTAKRDIAEVRRHMEGK